jgi:hypothetical protein
VTVSGLLIKWEHTMSDPTVHNEPSNVEAEGTVVHLHGPSNADISLTPKAALETARRLGDAAVEALLDEASTGEQRCGAVPD